MIAEGKVVSIHYQVSDSAGAELDSTEEGFPFRYVHGMRELAPGLEKALEGLAAGDHMKVTLAPSQGYGDGDESLRIAMSTSQLPGQIRLSPGESFPAENSDGEKFIFEVIRVEDDIVHVDGNHPFAGKTLQFDVSVIAVRDATSEEKITGDVGAGASVSRLRS